MLLVSSISYAISAEITVPERVLKYSVIWMQSSNSTGLQKRSIGFWGVLGGVSMMKLGVSEDVFCLLLLGVFHFLSFFLSFFLRDVTLCKNVLFSFYSKMFM